MKLKNIATISLILSLFVFGNIVIFGFLKKAFFLVHLFFTLSLFAVVLFSIKDILKNKGDLFLSLIMIILIAGLTSYSASTVKVYMDKSQEFGLSSKNLSLEIDNLSKTNDYLSNYSIYMNQQLKSLQNNSELMQSQINQLYQENSQKVVQVQQVQESEPAVQEQTIPLTPSPTIQNSEHETDSGETEDD
jgi:hypothetical protein